MTKKIIALVIAGMFLFSLAVYAVNNNENNQIENTIRQEVKKTIKATTTPNLDIVCMQTAVEKRENFMIRALENFASSSKIALEKRKNDLKIAWGITDKNKRRQAINKAWNEFNKTQKKIKFDYNKEKRAVWNQFIKERNNCKISGTEKFIDIEKNDLSL